MSRTTKILLAVIGGFVIVCCIGLAIFSYFGQRFLKESISTSPEDAAAAAKEIIDYELPAGYQEFGSMELFGLKMVFIGEGGGDETMVMMLMQFPASLGFDEEQMRQQMQQSWSQQTGSDQVNFSQVETKEITVGDQTTTLTIFEGTDESGNKVRQAFTAFEGKTGLVMLMAIANEDQWDAEGLDQFLGSIR